MTEAPSPGWYADPENLASQRYWDGTQWLVPVAKHHEPMREPEPTSASIPGDEPPKPGWYIDPADPATRRYWTGKQLTGVSEPAKEGDPVLPAAAAALGQKRADRAFLWTNYIVGAVIPIWGWGIAIYMAASEKYARIRRHAIGIAAVALTAAAIYAVVIVSVNKSHQDVNAATDLQSLLSDHGVFASNVNCVHQSGNQYECSATVNGQQEYASVTDDGQRIYEVGISTSGG